MHITIFYLSMTIPVPWTFPVSQFYSEFGDNPEKNAKVRDKGYHVSVSSVKLQMKQNAKKPLRFFVHKDEIESDESKSNAIIVKTVIRSEQMSGKATLGSNLEGESNVADGVPLKENVLNTAFVLSLQNPINPKEIAANNKNISRIGNLCDVPNLSKLNVSFNKLLESLDGIEQIPSLKDCWCYGCSIRDLTGLSALSKAEVLLLQHNKIESIRDVFKNMTKLRELRLDGNRLKKIEVSSLQSCQFLRRLDLSHNTLVSVDGLSGLQSLQELKLNNNKLTSVSALRGLPQLAEIDISHNYLKSLDGIQHFLKLEIVRANYNHMVHLQFQPYSNNNSNNTSEKARRATVLQTSSGNVPVNSSRPNKSSTSVTASSKTNAKKGDSSNSTTTTKSSVLPTLDKPVLTELYLSGNKIRTIVGLEMYQHSLEILDVSRNQFTDVMNLTAVLRDSHALTEFYLYGNPCAEDVTQMTTLRNVLQAHCPNFTLAFENVLMIPPEVDVEELYHHPNQHEDGGFHTWARDESTVAHGEDEETLQLLEIEKETTAKENDEKEKHLEEEKRKKMRNEEQEEEDDNDEINRMFLGPKLLLRSMLTQEQIFEKEQEFSNLLTSTKEKLHRTVFQFLYPDKYTNEDTKNPYSKVIQNNNNTLKNAEISQEKLDREALTSAAANKIREVLAAVAKMEPTPSSTFPVSSNSTSTASAKLPLNNEIKPSTARSQSLSSSSSTNIVMSAITEETMESLLSPGKPPKLAQQSSLVSLDIHLALEEKQNQQDNFNCNTSEPDPFVRSLRPIISHQSNTSKTKKKLHAQISFSVDIQSNNNNCNKQEHGFDVMDISNLASNVTSHGSKNWQISAVEKEKQQQISQAMTQRLLQTGVVAPEDVLRHEEELLAFSTVKIVKQKPERKLLVDANVNIVTTHALVAPEQQSKTTEEANNTSTTTKEVEEEDNTHPLSLSEAEQYLLERAVSAPLSQMVLRPMPLLFENEEDMDLEDADIDKEATAEEEEENEKSLNTSISLPSVSFKPNSIGFDRRYLEENDNITIGSAPVLLTPRDLSAMMMKRSLDNDDVSVITEQDGKKTVTFKANNRAHSAPLIRPNSSSSLRTTNPDNKKSESESTDQVSSSIPHTPVQPTTKATVVGGNRVVQPMTFLAADVHTKSMSSLLKFQLPPELQRMIDLEDAQSKDSARTISSKATPRSPGLHSARSTITDAKSFSVSYSAMTMATGAKDIPLIFSDEDIPPHDSNNSDSKTLLDSKRSQVWSDPVAAGKEQWVERIESRIFALSTKEAKAAVQMTTTPQAQLPSPNIFHPQSR